MKKLLLVLVVAALIAAAGFFGRRSNSDAAVVTVEALQNRSIRASILASGKLSHEQEVMLSTEVIGRVAALYVKEGDQVSEGQLVAQIDDEAPRAMVEQQRASTRMQEIAIESQKLRLKNLETQWERKRQVHARQLLDDDSFEAATNELELARLDVQTREASLAQARAMLEEAEKNLSRTRVLSPLAGVVSSLDIKVGEMAISSTTNVPGSSLMTIGNPSSIHTEVNVDEADIADIEVGQEAEVVAIGYPDSPMRGRVKEIAITAKPPTQTSTALSFVVKIAIDDSNGVVLHPGMSSRAEIFTSNNENLPSVPIAAVLLEEDRSLGSKKNYVFRFDDGVARKIEVGLGIADDTYQAIRSGLTLGDRFITGPNRVLRDLEDGDPVREAEEQDGTASSDSGRE